MTRGTFAFITDTNPASETAMQMIVSEEYNGDMGPDMVNGIKFGGEFFWKVETLHCYVHSIFLCMAGIVECLGTVEQCLRGDASLIQAHASQALLFEKHHT